MRNVWLWLTQAYRDGHYADFKGCSDRKEWLGMVLFPIAFYFLISMLGVICLIMVDEPNEVITWPIYLTASLGLVFALYSFVPGLSLTVRRLHDIGVSGWWSLFYVFSPFVSGMESLYWLQYIFVIVGIFVMLLPSKMDNNSYRVF